MKSHPSEEFSSSVAPRASNNLSSLGRLSPVNVPDVPMKWMTGRAWQESPLEEMKGKMKQRVHNPQNCLTLIPRSSVDFRWFTRTAKEPLRRIQFWQTVNLDSNSSMFNSFHCKQTTWSIRWKIVENRHMGRPKAMIYPSAITMNMKLHFV